eukprot:SAG31_NODE_15658_length_744_cov_0.955039_1_plen_161_part_00
MVEHRTPVAMAKMRRRELERKLKGYRWLQGADHGLKQRAGVRHFPDGPIARLDTNLYYAQFTPLRPSLQRSMWPCHRVKWCLNMIGLPLVVLRLHAESLGSKGQLAMERKDWPAAVAFFNAALVKVEDLPKVKTGTPLQFPAAPPASFAPFCCDVSSAEH